MRHPSFAAGVALSLQPWKYSTDLSATTPAQVKNYITSTARSLFTENYEYQIFDLRTPDNGLLIYTRRIGGPRDDDGAGAVGQQHVQHVGRRARRGDEVAAELRRRRDEMGDHRIVERLAQHHGRAVHIPAHERGEVLERLRHRHRLVRLHALAGQPPQGG